MRLHMLTTVIKWQLHMQCMLATEKSDQMAATHVMHVGHCQYWSNGSTQCVACWPLLIVIKRTRLHMWRTYMNTRSTVCAWRRKKSLSVHTRCVHSSPWDLWRIRIRIRRRIHTRIRTRIRMRESKTQYPSHAGLLYDGTESHGKKRKRGKRNRIT